MKVMATQYYSWNESKHVILLTRYYMVLLTGFPTKVSMSKLGNSTGLAFVSLPRKHVRHLPLLLGLLQRDGLPLRRQLLGALQLGGAAVPTSEHRPPVLGQLADQHLPTVTLQ